MGQARLERNVRYIFPIYLAIYNIESDPTFKKVWHKYMQIIKKGGINKKKTNKNNKKNNNKKTKKEKSY